MHVIFDRITKESFHFITLQRSRNYIMNMKLSIEHVHFRCRHDDVIKYININCFSHTLMVQRRLDSQLGEHLDQSDCAISSCSHEAFGIENLHRAHKYRFFSYCYANILGNFTRCYFYNSQSTHWNGILKGKRHFPVYFDLSLRRYAVAI